MNSLSTTPARATESQAFCGSDFEQDCAAGAQGARDSDPQL